MKLTNFYSVLGIDLNDVTGVIWNPDRIKRGVERAVADLSRHLPKESIYEEKLDFTVTDESFTTGASPAWIALVYSPIRTKSETVTNVAATVTYTRDTDYTMDYSNGQIRYITGGAMAATTSYLISYSKSRLGLNITNIVPDAHRITRVEFPVGNVPQQFATFSMYGDFLYVQSKVTGQSQMELSADHIAIYYDEAHTPPTNAEDGSYPSLYDELICIGGGGYLLLDRALELEHQAATDLASLRTELGLTTAIHALVVTALGKVDGKVSSMATAITSAGTQLTSAVAALGKINSDGTREYLTEAHTALVNFKTDVDLAVTALGKASTEAGTASTTLGGFSLTDINAALTAAKGVSDVILSTSIDKATTGAEAYLDTGDNNLLAVTDAPEADRHANYSLRRVEIANARVNVAMGHIQEANTRVAAMSALISQASIYNRDSESYIGEGAQRVQAALGHIQKSAAMASIADKYLAQATVFVDAANSYIASATAHYHSAQAFVEEASGRLRQIDQHLTEGRMWAEAVQGCVVLSDRYRTEGQLRLNEFESKLRNKVEYRKRISSVSGKQPA